MTVTIPLIDGQLQSEPPADAIHIINYGDHVVYLQTGEDDQIPQPAAAATEPPNWLAFRLEMMSNPNYSQMAIDAQSNNINRLTLQRLEQAISFDEPHLPTVAMMWEQLLIGLRYQPTSETINGWKQIATASGMPFSFADSGQISFGGQG